MKITAGTHVALHYKLYDPDGELVESTEQDEPVRYVHGREEILPGLERSLEGRGSGDTYRVELDPGDAYGEYNPDGLLYVPRADLPADLELELGEWIAIGVEDDEDPDSGGEEELEMRVVEIFETEVVMDANHPLAGKKIQFEVEVVSVEEG